jgi:ferredoxin
MRTTTHLIYYSPTGTTRKIAEQIAAGINADKINSQDLTLPGKICNISLTQGIALFAVPVYAGRVPELFLERIAELSGAGIPAIVVAVYGNRDFDDALVELEDVVSERGFKVCAAAAFIGEHSYATYDFPIALGRPDSKDLNQASEFGRMVAVKLQSGDTSSVKIAGNRPYRDRPALGGTAPDTLDKDCIRCKTCVKTCPTGAISLQEKIETNAADCVMCCACLRNCPTGARIFTAPLIQERRQMLTQNCSEPKQPQLFL